MKLAHLFFALLALLTLNSRAADIDAGKKNLKHALLATALAAIRSCRCFPCWRDKMPVICTCN